MKYLLLLILGFPFCVSKHGDAHKEILFQKAHYFDSIGNGIFNGYCINLIREGESPSYKVRRLDLAGEYAVITLKPSPKVEKNFLRDSINVAFVENFGMLDCYFLVCKDDFVRIDFS